MSTKSDNLVAVVIPIYKVLMSANEKVSILRCLQILENRHIYIIVPDSLDISEYLRINSDLKVKRFPNHFFDGIKGYNKLMLSWKFYYSFLQYKYILIYQLDCYVFNDTLDYWCNQGYDYIGAPWINIDYLENKYVSERLPKWVNLLIKYSKNKNRVGNGGLSLRKTKKFFAFSFLLKRLIKKWKLHEDIFWSFIPALILPFAYKIPDTQLAVAFSFETEPAACFELNNHSLPFGCHAWEKFDLNFWKNYIDKPCID